MSKMENIEEFTAEPVSYCDAPITISIRDSKGNIFNKDIFRVQSLHGQEAISQPYELQAVLRVNDGVEGSSAHDINFDNLLGQPISIGYILPFRKSGDSQRDIVAVSASDHNLRPQRYFSGIIADFSFSAPGEYTATIRPSLWIASLTNRYQLYSSKTISAVLEEVLTNHNIDYKMYLDSIAIDREQDWIQTGESDLDFIQRLMQKSNIYYYFEHQADAHVMVIANMPQYKPILAMGESSPLKLHYTHSSQHALGAQEDEHISSYNYKKTVSQSGVFSLLIRSEAAWEADNVAGFSQYEAQHSDVYRLPFRDCKVYQYGGSSNEVEALGEKNWDMIQSAATSLSGGSSNPMLCAGHTFITENTQANNTRYEYPDGYTAADYVVRPELEGVEFVVMQVQHKISTTEPYTNSFEATQADKLITQFSLQNTQQGSILGTVVADETAKNPKSWKYRDKDNFYREPHSAKDLSSGATLRDLGVFVRLATDGMSQQGPVWIKLAQHMQTVPEVGVTVSIGRSNDDSEMPEVQSIVQSNGSKTIMPSGWTANTSVGSNISTSFGDSKSIRFGLTSDANLDAAIDKIEKEYARNEFKDVSFSQGASYSYTTSENGKSGLLSESETHGSTRSKYFGGFTTSYSEIDRSESHSKIDYSYSKSEIGSADSYTEIQGKSYSNSIIGSQSSDTHIKGSNDSVTTIDGATSSTTIHNSNINSKTTIKGNQETKSFTKGNADNQSQTIGATSNMNMFVGAKNNMDLSVSASNMMAVNASISNDMSVNFGLHANTKVDAGVNIDTHINATADIKNEFKLFQSKTKTTPLEVITEPANVKARIGNIDVEIMTFKIFM